MTKPTFRKRTYWYPLRYQSGTVISSASRLKTVGELKIDLAGKSRRSMRERMADARASYIPTLTNLALGPTHQQSSDY